MFSQNYKKNYIITLIDTSENEIENSICMEGFAHHQFLLLDKPGYAISQEMKETPFSAGDVIYVAAGRRFGLRCNGKMHIRHIAFTGRNIRPLLHYCNFGEFRVTSTSSVSNINRMFDNIFSLKTSQGHDKYIDISTELYALLAALGEANIENDNYIFDKRSLILRPVIDFMQCNYRKTDISYDAVAASLGMTINDINNSFIDVFSISAADFYKQLRMENAKHLLFFYASYGIDYIANNMGYENVSLFEADFYDVFKLTPQDFIRSYWDNDTFGDTI